MACATSTPPQVINLQGVDAKRITRKIYPPILHYCGPAIGQLKATLYSKDILTQPERDSVITIEDLLKTIERHASDEIVTFLTIICSDEKILTRQTRNELERQIREAIKAELGAQYCENIPLFTTQEGSDFVDSGPRVNHIGLELEAQPCLPEINNSSAIPLPQTNNDCPDPLARLRNGFAKSLKENWCTILAIMLVITVLYFLVFVANVNGVTEAPEMTQTNRTITTELIPEGTPLPDQTHLFETVFQIPENLSTSSPSSIINITYITNTPNVLNTTIPAFRTQPIVPEVVQQPQPDAPPPIDFSNIFEPPKAVVYQITEMGDVKNYRKGICGDKDKTLNMSFSNKEDIWEIAPDCSEKVTGMVISGPFSLNDIITLLRNFFPNIKYLVFSGGRICAEIDDTSEELETVPSNKMSLLELRYLKFENITECPKLYKSVESWHTPKLDKFVMQDVFLNEINQKSVENIITTNPQMQAFSLTGYLCKQCLPLSKKLKWPNLKYLHLDVQNPWVAKASEFNNNLLKTSNLHYFKSNILLTEKGVKFLKRSSQNLVFLDMAILFNDTRNHFNVSSFKRFANLKHMHLKLQFSNKSVCHVQKSPVLLEGLKILVKRLPGIEEISFASNCNIKPSEWQLPCRDYVYGFDDIWNMKLVTIKRQEVCTSNKG